MGRPTIFQIVTVDEGIFLEIILVYFLAFYFAVGNAATDQVQITIGNSDGFMELWDFKCDI